MNYTTLKTLVADYLHRTDLTDKLETFIALAESLLFREINIKALEVVVTGTSVAGSIALPAGTVNRITVSYGGNTTALDYASQPSTYGVGVPTSYTLEGGVIKLDTTTSQAYTLYYTPTVEALSVSNPTNWLLDNAPDLYLCAAQLEGAKYVKDEGRIASLGAMLAPLLDSVQRLTQRTGQPTRGGMQVRPRRG